uniref:hypothetical protein n=1 Tax=Pedobacter schmidteae TaxID=2201271 RepID=UPI0013CF3ADC|nr:hypothetical protein [Pedobacter schmidteae]
MEEIMKKLNYQPNTLSATELNNPEMVIADFFDNNELHEVRDKLWELYKGWVNNSVDFAEGPENADMLYLYGQLINMLNATYISNEKKKS